MKGADGQAVPTMRDPGGRAVNRVLTVPRYVTPIAPRNGEVSAAAGRSPGGTDPGG
jgi:hypothetical protein